MTYKQLKDFIEKKNVRHEINALYSEPYDVPVYKDGKLTWEEHRAHLGFEIGMCNIAGRKGKSEWQWTWYTTLLCPEKLEDDTILTFRNRYSMLTGRDHRGWRESMNADNTIETRMLNL